MRKLSDWLYRISRGWIVWTSLAIFVFFVIFLLPAQGEIAVNGSTLPVYPDLAFRYSPDQLYRFAEAYGASGRAEYVRMRWRFDIIWPLVYVGFLAVSLSRTLGNIPNGPVIFRRLNLLPICAGIFDLLENICASVVMLRYPRLSRGIDILAALSTTLKWSILALGALTLMVGLNIVIIRKVRR